MTVNLLLAVVCVTNISGLWDTDYGRIIIEQDGPKIKCICSEGYTLVGTMDGDTGKAYGQDAEGLHLKLTIRQKGKRLVLIRRHDGDVSRYGARRLKPDQNVVWLVTLETYWQDDLGEPEYSWGQTVESVVSPYQDIIYRHRFFNNEEGFRLWCDQMRFVPDPIILFIASHGRRPGLRVRQKLIEIHDIIDSLRGVNLKLVHFGSCLIGTQDTCDLIAKECHCAVSGFSTEVDWDDSLAFDVAYLTLLVIREMEPKKAASEVFKKMPLSKGSITNKLDFHFSDRPK